MAGNPGTPGGSVRIADGTVTIETYEPTRGLYELDDARRRNAGSSWRSCSVRQVSLEDIYLRLVGAERSGMSDFALALRQVRYREQVVLAEPGGRVLHVCPSR